MYYRVPGRSGGQDAVLIGLSDSTLLQVLDVFPALGNTVFVQLQSFDGVANSVIQLCPACFVVQAYVCWASALRAG